MSVRPAPVTGAQPGWARQSIVERLPAVLKQLERDHIQHAPNTAPRWLQLNRALSAEITGDHVLDPALRSGPHVTEWRAHLAQLSAGHNTWLSAPWYLVETYFYRRLLDNTGYFDTPREQHAALPNMGIDHVPGDPFAHQKWKSLHEAQCTIDTYVQSVSAVLAQPTLSLRDFEHVLAMTLWSNRADLSKNPHGISAQAMLLELEQGREQLLIDHTQHVHALLAASQTRQLEWVLDNAGLELFADLVLLDVLVHFALIDHVTIHCKYHPTFVSDVIREDVQHTLVWMEQHVHLQPMAARWRAYLTPDSSGHARWTVAEHYYWNHYTPFWADMPSTLQHALESATLVVIKGDMNTRRVHGDLRWPFTTDTAAIAHYLRANLVLIRTLKSETASGLTQQQLDVLQKDPSWLWSGEYGVIQLIPNKVQ